MNDHEQRQLTPERLFGNPPLEAPLPAVPQFADQDRTVLFLFPRADDRALRDLWRYDVDGSETQAYRWLTLESLADLIADSTATESEAERAERERRRQFQDGIGQFLVRPEHAEVLVVVGGQAILVDLATTAARKLTASPERQTAFQFSPKGRYLSFVRDGELFAVTVDEQRERQLTFDAGTAVSNGMADFIAQEEMHRFSGHWWSPDENAIALQRTDEAAIPIAHRHDIKAGTIEVVEQRYPYAGGPNADVSLGIIALEDGSCRWLDYSTAAGDYLARVDWHRAGLFVQVQSRNQQRLRLLHCVPANTHRNELRLLLEETSDTWINLHDNLVPLSEREFAWTSERDGCQRLYVGRLAEDDAPATLEAVAPELKYVAAVLACADDQIWCCGWREAPTERHLYCVSRIRGHWQPARQISTEAGWHEPTLSKDMRLGLDIFSALDAPPRLLLRHLQHQQTSLLTQPGAPAYRAWAAAHVTPELGQLRAANGDWLQYRLTRPARGRDPAPAIVYVYGGPGAQLVRNAWPPLLLQLFAQAGFAVFELDNRGSSGRGRAFESGIYRALGTVEVADQQLGARYIAGLDGIDGDRIGVFGHSYGGFMTLKCLLAAPELFAAGVSVAPVTDWTLYDTHYTERYLGHPVTDPDDYARAGVLEQIAGLTRPLLLMHGMADDNVLFANTTALLAKLQQALIPFELMTYPGSKHALQEPEVQMHRFAMILEFFQRRLGAAGR